MSAVYVNNLVINAGSDFSQTFTLEETESNSFLNLTDYQIDSQMRKWSGSSNAITFTTAVEFPSTSGKMNLSLTSEQTKNIKPGRYVYDILLTDSFGQKNKVIEGMVLVREGVTR
jgi:hypothetical protein